MTGSDPELDIILDAARGLIAQSGYSGLTMPALAQAAGIPIAELYRHVPDRVALLAGFIRRIDLAMLESLPPAEEGGGARDRIFDVLMARFEASAPSRAMLRVVQHDMRRHPAEALRLAPVLLNAMRWTAEAAGLSVDGVAGAARLRALAGVYASVMPVWLADEDPGLAKTMAALDRRLRRLENLWPDIWCGGKRSKSAQSDPPGPSTAAGA